MNRISIRGVAAATAMAGVSILAATGTAAFTGDGSAASDSLRSWQRQAVTPDGSAVRLAMFEPIRTATVLRPAVLPHAVHHRRASRSLSRARLAPRELGRLMAAERGWHGAQWTCLDALWTRESNWRVYAENASSGAYGIPQALPARKLATAGSNWRTSAHTQIRWGLSYIGRSYGSPCRAWRHSRNYGYY